MPENYYKKYILIKKRVNVKWLHENVEIKKQLFLN